MNLQADPVTITILFSVLEGEGVLRLVDRGTPEPLGSLKGYEFGV